jgi:glucosyl-3-phosphoglycerate phosphatase
MSHHRGIDRLLALAAAQPLEVACESFHFLRHGQTARNALRIFQDLDEPLDATGLAQAGRAAHTLRAERFSTIACSPLPRARTTAGRVVAALAAAGHTRAPQYHDGLRERHFGELIGTSSAQIDWDCAPAGGETLSAFVARARAGLAWALAQPGPVLVVAHGGTLYVLAGLLGVPLSAALLANAHPLRFERAGGGWAVQPLQAPDPHATNNLS